MGVYVCVCVRCDVYEGCTTASLPRWAGLGRTDGTRPPTGRAAPSPPPPAAAPGGWTEEEGAGPQGTDQPLAQDERDARAGRGCAPIIV